MHPGPPPRRFVWRRRLAAVLLSCLAGNCAQAQDNLEQQVKAAFLFNFAKFVSWPPAKLPGSDDPIVYCVVEHDPLASALQAALAGKSIDSHPLLLRRVAAAGDFRACDIAYLGTLDGSSLPAALAAMAGAGVLSVYEGDVTMQHGVVRFFIDERKVRFEINTGEAERQGLQMSSRLLGVAVVVRE